MNLLDKTFRERLTEFSFFITWIVRERFNFFKCESFTNAYFTLLKNLYDSL